MSPRLRAVLQAFFVTFLWSTSFVLVTIGLDDIPALTFAGLRYVVAFLCLLPFALNSARRVTLRSLSRQDWMRLSVLGVLFYTVNQGAIFVALDYLPGVTVSVILNFSAIIVALMGIVTLAEHPTRLQWLGMMIAFAGAWVYFYPADVPDAELVGFIAALACVLSYSVSSVLGRYVNRDGRIDPLSVTVVSMGIGSVLLLLAGLLAQGMPSLSLSNGLNVVFLAVVNTACAFTLWNHTQRTLSAMESSIINNTMLGQIAVLGWVFLGQALGAKEIGGIALVALGTLLVQLRKA